jgi:hypothetical protein
MLIVYKWKLYCLPSTCYTARKQTKAQQDKATDIEGSGACAFPLKKSRKEKARGVERIKENRKAEKTRQRIVLFH